MSPRELQKTHLQPGIGRQNAVRRVDRQRHLKEVSKFYFKLTLRLNRFQDVDLNIGLPLSLIQRYDESNRIEQRLILYFEIVQQLTQAHLSKKIGGNKYLNELPDDKAEAASATRHFRYK